MTELETETARVAKMASEAQHAASAAALLGGTTRPFIKRRDDLLSILRRALAAGSEGREADALVLLRGVQNDGCADG